MRISIIISQIELEMLTHAWRLRCSNHRSARISWKIFIYWNFLRKQHVFVFFRLRSGAGVGGSRDLSGHSEILIVIRFGRAKTLACVTKLR